MKAIPLLMTEIAVLLSAPASARDRFSGTYESSCAPGVLCSLGISATSDTEWDVNWVAVPEDDYETALCQKNFEIFVGGPEGVFLDGIATSYLDDSISGFLDRGDG